jgi:DNA-binding transcriptional LysR family regulator
VNRRIDLNDIRLLMQVVEHGSYSAAARATGIPKSTISQRITALEATIGTGLLRRTSRSFSLTEAGARLLPHARAIEDLARQVETALNEQGSALQGTLRVSCSNAIAQFAVSPIVPQFLDEHDKVSIRVEATNRLVDLVGEGYDMTVRGHVAPLKDSTLIQRVVARTPWILAASPRWIASHGLPVGPEDLPGLEAVCFSTSSQCQSWTFRKGEEIRSVEVTPRIISDDMITLRASVVADGGIACLPGYLMREDIASGNLVRILPEWIGDTSSISVLTPPKVQSSKLARAFSDFLAARLPSIMQF